MPDPYSCAPLGPTRAERLADQIAEAILDGRLKPGTHLDEVQLSEAFGVSRSPLREALRLLAGTGLVESRRYTGTWVRSLSPEEVASLFQAMGEVEASCARLSALSMNNLEQAALADLHTRMGVLAEAADYPGYVEANRAFHGLVYEGTHNPTLSKMAVSLRRQLMPYRMAQFHLQGRLSLSHAEHGRVVRAILARDAQMANAAMLLHMSVVEEAFEGKEALRSQKQGSANLPSLPSMDVCTEFVVPSMDVEQ